MFSDMVFFGKNKTIAPTLNIVNFPDVRESQPTYESVDIIKLLIELPSKFNT